jgi:hypothetical protein
MLALLLAAAVSTQSSFEAAMRAYGDVDLRAAQRLFADAAAHDPDPHRCARAALRLAYIEWHIDRDAPAARKWLDSITDEETIPAVWIERARVDEELTGDFAAARDEAAHALEAPKPIDRISAVLLHARASIEPAMRGQSVDAARLQEAKSKSQFVIAAVGPVLEAAHLELDAAILTNDGAAALDAWRAYYGATAQSAILAPAEKGLQNWSDRRGVGLALARSAFFREASLVLRELPKESRDAEVSDVIAYASFVAKVKQLTDDYFRDVALKRADTKAFRDSFDAAGQTLWNELSWPEKRPRFSSTALDDEVERRFNAVVRMSNTVNRHLLFLVERWYVPRHYAHKVSDENRSVTQFGREAPLHFVVLDGVVSNNFNTWYGPSGGDGGWADADAIFQVRPMYANGPLIDWQQTTNPVLRAERDRNASDETARDVERAREEPIRFFPGVQLRLRAQYNDAVLDELKRNGLAGQALRNAFIARLERDTFESSIWAHEGRHAIDKKHDHLTSSPELEFRAKLSQLEFAPSARHAVIDIGGAGNPEFADTPHGKANRRLAQTLAAWMKDHIAEINTVDTSKPLMLQLDKLTEDQLRAAARSADPYAR